MSDLATGFLCGGVFILLLQWLTSMVRNKK
jgi:hypothetical protein